MSNETPTIEAEIRDRTGTRYARRLRATHRLPGIIYGAKTEPLSISVDEKEVLEILHDGNLVMNLKVGGAEETCLVKDLQFGYLGDNVIHVDFARVKLDDEVTVAVHIHFIGEPAKAKEAGVILTHDLTELGITCRVRDIPDEIVVDLSEMEMSITVGELSLPAGLQCNLDPSTTVARINFVAAEEAEGEAVEVEGGEGEPEVITEAAEEKKED